MRDVECGEIRSLALGFGCGNNLESDVGEAAKNELGKAADPATKSKTVDERVLFSQPELLMISARVLLCCGDDETDRRTQSTAVHQASGINIQPRRMGAILAIMRPTLALLLCVIAALSPASAQAPQASTLNLSLKTMNKALDSCRNSYTRQYPGSTGPLLKSIVGAEDYGKDLRNLDIAQKFINALITYPTKVTGKALVAIVSSSDDFSIGVGSTRVEVLRHMVLDGKASQSQLTISAESLNNCQKGLFDAGDDFVGLVMNYVGNEDDLIASQPKR